jgi:hypothetical protein
MPGIQQWIKEQKGSSLFEGPEALAMATLAAKYLLEISPTNRVVNVRFARLAIAVRQIAIYLNGDGTDYNFLMKVVDMAEEYQLTIGETKNSREAFLEAVKAQFAHFVRAESGNKRGILGI